MHIYPEPSYHEIGVQGLRDSPRHRSPDRPVAELPRQRHKGTSNRSEASYPGEPFPSWRFDEEAGEAGREGRKTDHRLDLAYSEFLVQGHHISGPRHREYSTDRFGQCRFPKMMQCADRCLDIANLGLLMALVFFSAVAIIAWLVGRI